MLSSRDKFNIDVKGFSRDGFKNKFRLNVVKIVWNKNG